MHRATTVSTTEVRGIAGVATRMAAGWWGKVVDTGGGSGGAYV